MILKKFAKNYREFNRDFGFLFNSYYNSVGERTTRANRGDLSRPTIQKVYQYRKYVDQQMLKFLRQDLSEEVKSLIILGLNHEQQHQELLLTDLKYILSCNPLLPVYREKFFPEETGKIHQHQTGEFVNIEAGIYEIGFDGRDGFSFDNEHARHKVYLEDYAIRKNLVTNGEFLEFIADGGYHSSNLSRMARLVATVSLT
jgi:formylglycine-generating enzyme required for sulfatase activity